MRLMNSILARWPDGRSDTEIPRLARPSVPGHHVTMRPTRAKRQRTKRSLIQIRDSQGGGPEEARQGAASNVHLDDDIGIYCRLQRLPWIRRASRPHSSANDRDESYRGLLCRRSRALPGARPSMARDRTSLDGAADAAASSRLASRSRGHFGLLHLPTCIFAHSLTERLRSHRCWLQPPKTQGNLQGLKR